MLTLLCKFTEESSWQSYSTLAKHLTPVSLFILYLFLKGWRAPIQSYGDYTEAQVNNQLVDSLYFLIKERVFEYVIIFLI
jgi:hypothetical protein